MRFLCWLGWHRPTLNVRMEPSLLSGKGLFTLRISCDRCARRLSADFALVRVGCSEGAQNAEVYYQMEWITLPATRASERMTNREGRME